MIAWNQPRLPAKTRTYSSSRSTRLRADRVGAYGYSAGPAPRLWIDALAAEGTTLPSRRPPPSPGRPRAWLRSSPVCGPMHHGSREVAQPLAEVTTLAAVLKEQGYTTLAASANGAASPHQKMDQGFETLSRLSGPGAAYRWKS